MLTASTKHDTVFLDVRVDDIEYAHAMRQCSAYLSNGTGHQIVTVNPEFIMEARRNARFRAVLNNASLRLPDGFGLRVAALLTRQPLHHRVTGVDAMIGLCALAAKNKCSIFLLGGEDGIARKAAESLTRKFPDLQITGTESFPVFRSGEETNEEVAMASGAVIDRINNSGATVLFVAFGAPKQDVWIATYLYQMANVRIAIGVGGTFDFLAKRIRRAPFIFRSIGMEWLWRLLLQPSRYRRIFTAVFRFPLAVITHPRAT